MRVGRKSLASRGLGRHRRAGYAPVGPHTIFQIKVTSMSKNTDDSKESEYLSRIVNALFQAGVVIALLLALIITVAATLDWFSWQVSVYIFAQILLGFVSSVIILLVLARMRLVFGKANPSTKLINIGFTVFVLLASSFLMALIAVRWPLPETTFLEKGLSNLGFVAGVAIGSRTYRMGHRG
jgi:hypothetical protein